MVRTLALLTLTLAPAAFAQGAPTCGSFSRLDSTAQIEMLTTIQPLGDEIDANDADAARQWAAEVTQACGNDEGRPLADAAREALGE